MDANLSRRLTGRDRVQLRALEFTDEPEVMGAVVEAAGKGLEICKLLARRGYRSVEEQQEQTALSVLRNRKKYHIF